MRDRFITRAVHDLGSHRFVAAPDRRWWRAGGVLAAAAVVGLFAAVAPAGATPTPFLAQFGSSTGVTPTSEVGPTVPNNGDVNPYGLVEITQSVGRLVAGEALVSNFNNSSNQQGTGTTLVEVSGSSTTVFAEINPNALPGSCPGGVGLTTALSILPGGWVVVGSLPAAQGKPQNAEAGCLIVLNSMGTVVETIAGGQINGPWDMTSVAFGDFAELFVTNVLNGTVAGDGVSDPTTQTGHTVYRGTVVRLLVFSTPSIAPKVLTEQVIANGFGEHTDPSALVVGPTGVALGANGTLYVADSVSDRITAVPGAAIRFSSSGPGFTVTAGGLLSGPLGMTLAPNGDILTVNSANSEIVETTPSGQQVDSLDLGNPASPGSDLGGGALFGMTIGAGGSSVLFVDDLNNFLDRLGGAS
jgi:hypothetical protein